MKHGLFRNSRFWVLSAVLIATAGYLGWFWYSFATLTHSAVIRVASTAFGG